LALVQIGNRVQTQTAGAADLLSGRPIAPDDTIRIASVSKAFNGAVALALVSDGRLSLDATIGALLHGLPSAWGPVTLDQLLQHTSGLPDYTKSPAFLAALQANPEASMTPTQLLSYAVGEPLLFPPGTRYDYSDTDNIVVGLMVESATGTSYESALAATVTTPLDLTGTTLPTGTALASPFVHGYAIDPGHPPEDVTDALNPVLAWTSGGMVSTPSELNTFLRAYVRGALFDARTRAAQLRFVPGASGPPGPGTNAAGLALYRYETTCGTVYGHTGNYPGYTVFAASTLDGSRSAVVVVNEQLNDRSATPAFTALRRVWGLAVCAAVHG
jgi:D-alanyl-D-alanine carboxypeptidase